jgi:hypothetical protein
MLLKQEIYQVIFHQFVDYDLQNLQSVHVLILWVL